MLFSVSDTSTSLRRSVMESRRSRPGLKDSPLPCYRLRGSPACVGAPADGSLRWATAERPIPCISLTQMATGGSSHPEAARHVGLAADAWLGRYMRAVSFGWANVHLFAHRCARHSTLFGDLTDLTGILPVQRLIGLTVRPGLPPRAARGGQLTCRCQPERCQQFQRSWATRCCELVGSRSVTSGARAVC